PSSCCANASRPKEAEGSDFDSAAPEESWKQIAAFLGVPVEFDAPGRAAKTVDNMAAFRRDYLRESPGVCKSARDRSTFRIDSSAGDSAPRAHVHHVVF